MASSPDDMRARIEAYPWPARRGGIEVGRANKGYTLYSLRAGGPVARLRPTGQGDRVQVLWCAAGPGATRAPLAARSCHSMKPSHSSPPTASSGSTLHDARGTARAKPSLDPVCEGVMGPG